MISGYKRLDYIESSGTQYIDTLVQVSNTIKFVVNTSFTEYVDGSGHGAYGSSGDYRFHIGSGSATSLHYGISNSNGSTNVSSIETPTKITIDAINKNISINDTSVLTTSGSINFSNNIYLFKINSSSSTYYKAYAKSRVYDSQIYDNGTLVRDYLPCLRESDNEVGLYDEVNDVFYANQGTGSFTYGHILENNITLTDNPLTLTLGDDLSLIGNFELRYTITLNYDSTLGSATYSWGSGTTLNLVATPNSNVQFLGWYYNSQLISSNTTTTYSVTQDSTFEARFERIYNVSATTHDDKGAIQYTRGTTDENLISFSVIPITHYHFSKYVISGYFGNYAQLQAENSDFIITQDGNNIVASINSDTEVTTTPYTLRIYGDITCVAYFEEDEKYHINAQADLSYTSVYQSATDVYGGTSVTLWARPFPNYNFEKWSDGTTSNPKTIVVNSDVTIVAEYVKVTETNGIYQYRCYVKDQLDLTASPKAFMIVDTFSVREDYLTNATSYINVLEMTSNVNNGDVIVLYNPKGETIYQGVITSIEDTTINCSQMQSFYKGTWIYNVSPQSTLEQEISVLLNDYADGEIYGSSYTDPLVAERLGGITIQYVGSTTANLPTEEDDEMDMEEFIYSLYQDYGIIFDFQINFSGANYVTIKVPTYSSIKVGNNMYAIQNMSPITEIEETNRLIIFAKDGTYRTTYVATKNGIVEAPTSTANRFNITNTKIVKSDDAVADLVANNLPTTMYNHKVTFTLILKNFIYGFDEFKLGMPIDVWYGSDYYSSVLTGWEISKSSNQNVTSVDFVCGLVRKKLTQMLTLKKV